MIVNNYKRFIEKAKSTASDFISSRSEEQEGGTIELNPQYYIELEGIAERQKTTVQSIVNEIIVQYLESTSYEPIPISVDQKEDNPLLYLDGICKLED